ncbi:MAG TPA: hypothetical protein VK524_33575 [Polyangiaceae bacterium]|nr:hypothetical protein [Polyangiaceae bacterium]
MTSSHASRVFLAATGIALLGCVSAPTQPTEPTFNELPISEAPVSEAPPAEPPAEEAAPSSELPSSEAPAAGGRLAFTNCDAENRPQACTREYKPVCGEVDTGVRCIKAPCPSTQQRTFGNACTACAEPKTTGYWPVSCEEMKKENASQPAE